MPAPRATLLRETPQAAQTGTVIDARYEVVKGKKNGILRRIKTALTWILLAALIGFLIPPTWVLVQDISATLAR